MKSTIFKNILDKIKFADSVLIQTHEFPDGDALGSTLSMYLVLKKLGVSKIKIAYSRLNEDKWSFIPYLNGVQLYSAEPEESFDLAIVLDSGSLDRLGANKSFVNHAEFVINIDHHMDNTQFGDINFILDRSAVGEILYELFNEWNIEFDKGITYCLLVSIITDTGRFLYSNTRKNVFHVMNELMGYVSENEYHAIVRDLYDEQPHERLEFQQQMLENMEILNERIVFSYLPFDDGYDLIDVLRAVKGVDGAVFVRKVDPYVKISFRSKRESFNAQELASLFGGGGHRQAAGAKLSLTDFDAQLKFIRQQVINYIS